MPAAHPPGPRPLPIVGHLPLLLRDPLGFLGSLAREHGDVAAFRVGLRPMVLINHPALIDRVVRDRSFERSPETRRGLSSFLGGDGLLSLEGSTHLRHRRLMQPAFHRERMRLYAEFMVEECGAALSRWQHGSTLDVCAEMMRLTFSIVSRALFNSDTRDEAAEVDRAMREIGPAVMWRAQLSRAIPLQLPYVYARSTRKAIARLQAVVGELVARRRREGGDRGDLLSMLLAARDEDGSALSDEDVAAESLTLLLAGHETTATTLSWALYLLTQHPELQEALAREVRGCAGDDAQVGFDHLPHLQLTERVVQETLRLYPAAWWGDRTPQSAAELGGYHIPAGTTVVFSVYVMQRDARFFAEPERFDPDRFLPERAGDIPAGAHLPFGAGVHICIGAAFAMLEARLILASICQRFRFESATPHAVRPRPLITLGMAEPFHISVEARHKARTDRIAS